MEGWEVSTSNSLKIAAFEPDGAAMVCGIAPPMAIAGGAGGPPTSTLWASSLPHPGTVPAPDDGPSPRQGALASRPSLDRLSAVFMQELARPLAAAMNYLNAAQRLLHRDGPEATGLSGEYLRQTGEQIMRAGHLLRRAWDHVALGETGGAVRDLGSVLEDAVALAALTTRDPDLRMGTDLAFDTRFVPVQSAQVGQVAVSLIQAAAAAVRHRRSPAILVSARASLQQNRIEVTVLGTGAGPPADDAAPARPAGAPTGESNPEIALAACEALAAAHGGQLSVESVADGTAFRLTLPIMPGMVARSL